MVSAPLVGWIDAGVTRRRNLAHSTTVLLAHIFFKLPHAIFKIKEINSILSMCDRYSSSITYFTKLTFSSEAS